jgi:hypothetical protein
MLESIIEAILAHKHFVSMALVAVAVLATYMAPSNTAVAEGPPHLSVNTPNSFINILDGTLAVNTPGTGLERPIGPK